MTKKILSRPPTSGRIKVTQTISEDTNTRAPIYSFEYMVDGYCVASCNQEEKALFAEALHRRGKVTWQMLMLSGRHGLGCEKINKKQLKVGLPKNVTEDVDILAFRCIGLKPMIGYRDGRIFHILWIDKDFKVYKHDS